MKRILVLAALMLLAAGVGGCQSWDCLHRGSPMPVQTAPYCCNPVVTFDSCGSCGSPCSSCGSPCSSCGSSCSSCGGAAPVIGGATPVMALPGPETYGPRASALIRYAIKRSRTLRIAAATRVYFVSTPRGSGIRRLRTRRGTNQLDGFGCSIGRAHPMASALRAPP